LQFLQQRGPANDQEREQLTELAKAACLGIGREIATFALGHLGKKEVYDMPLVCRFFDSANAAVRSGAWDWLEQKDSAGWRDATLWARLTETPYDDVRMRLVDTLALRAEAPKLAPSDLAPVWTTVLLGIHRGSRQKLRVLREIADAVITHPDQHGQLLPVMTATVRSIRGPEARTALSSVLSVIERVPSLESEIVKALPELNLHPQEAKAA
jgi:hypothetical protein